MDKIDSLNALVRRRRLGARRTASRSRSEAGARVGRDGRARARGGVRRRGREGACPLADLGDRTGGRRARRRRSTTSTWRAAAARCTASPCRRSTCAAWRTTPRARSSAPRSGMNAGAFILEIARSEIAYTDQRPGGVRRGDARGRAARGLPRAGVHPGRSLPGQREEVRGRSEDRSRRGEGARARGDRRRLLQHRHRHVDARRPLEADARRAAAARTTRSASTSCADGARAASRRA